MTIGIVLGSIREGRFGASVADWVTERAGARDGAQYRLLDLKAFDVPLLTSAVMPAAAKGQYEDPRVRAWGAAVDACDGFVFVTPEYNHGLPGAFKNAFDSLYPEWLHKPVGFVAYGYASGVRAVEHWRPVVANASMFALRAQVSFSLVTDVADGAVAPTPRHASELDALLSDLERTIAATAPLRS